MVQRIFVYGSLKPGGWAHNRIQDKVENPKPGAIRGDLFNVNNKFPALKLGSDKLVQGILYDVSYKTNWEELLHNLDSLEGYPYLYDRKIVPVEIGPDMFQPGLVYFGVNPKLFEGELIASGEWIV